MCVCVCVCVCVCLFVCVCQVEDMRAQLLRTEKERVELKQQVARLFAQRNETSGQEEGRRDGGGVAGVLSWCAEGGRRSRRRESS